MKTFEELTDKEKEKAINHYTNELLTVIVQGGVRFNDELNEDALQASIDEAIEEAEKMKTPWFAGEYVMDARYRPMEGHVTGDDGLWPVAEAIRSMAMCDAEDSLYLEDGECAIHLS